MSITYSSGTITIAGETATPEDLWDADQAGGWGVVSRQGLSARYQYYIAAQISLGVGGHFVCEELDVIINGGNKSPIVSTSSDSGMRFGAIDANGDTYNGCSVTFVCTSTASLIEFPVGAANLSDACDFEVYASTVDGYFAGPNGLFGRFYRGDDQIVKIRDSTFQNMKFGMRLRGTASFMKDVEFSNISGIFSPFTTYGELGGGISGILVRKSYQGAYFQSDFGDATVRNFAARNNTRTMNFRNVAGSSGNYYSIDGNLETPLDIFWQFNNTVSKFFVQFSFNKTYKKASDSSPLEGARVYIEDADGTQATNATTNASGVLAEQVLTKETYRYLDGDTPTALTPHVVTTYAEKTLVVGEYNHNFLEIPQSIDGAPVGSSTTRQEYRLGTDAQVTKTKAQAAAITGVVVDVPTDTIDLGGNTLADAYDSLKYQVTADADIDTGVPGCMYACLYGLPLTKSGTTYTARSATTVYQGVTIGTDTFAGGIVEWDTPGTYAGGTWNGNTFRFTAAGTYDFRSAEFIGTVVLTATVPGVIVQVAPSVSYDDTDPNVTVDASVAITIANANLIDGSRVQLYNVTQDAEMENTTVSGGAGYSYTATLGPGQEVEDGDTIRLRATWASGASYKENYEETNAASSSGITFLGTQTDWAAANGLGIDGSLQTEFTADYPNVQVDITASGNLFNVGDLVAWLCHIQTTADGIRNFFGGLEGQDAGNWIIQSATVDLRLDNTSAQTAVQGDNVILVRDDRVYPQAVPTSGGGIGMLMGGSVFIVETGVSGLTPAESSKLLAIPTAADVWAVDLSGAAAADSAADVVKKAKGAAEGAFAVSV
jgi:hypothetical protein